MPEAHRPAERWRIVADRNALCCGLLLTLAILGAGVAHAQGPAHAEDPSLPRVFTEDSLDHLKPGAQELLETIFGPMLLYGRSVRVNPAVFDHDKPGDRVVFNLFSGVSFEAVCIEGGSPYPGLRHWVGRIVGYEDNSGISLVIDTAGLVQGYVNIGDRAFSIKPLETTGWTTLVELASKRNPELKSNQR